MGNGAKLVIGGEEYLHRGTLKEDAFARTDLVEKDGRKLTYKTSRLKAIPGLRLEGIMKRLTAREVRMHHVLEGIAGVPKLVKQVDDTSFLREYVEGRPLNRKPPFLRPDFFDEFIAIVRNIHSRGVAFVDLAKKENVIVTPEGRPVLIDFQISLSLTRRWWPLCIPWNALVRQMQKADIYHVYKRKARTWPHSVRRHEKRYTRRPWSGKVYKFLIRIPHLAVKRRIIPKHGDSRYPFFEDESCRTDEMP
jgi:hypothetical protein